MMLQDAKLTDYDTSYFGVTIVGGGVKHITTFFVLLSSLQDLKIPLKLTVRGLVMFQSKMHGATWTCTVYLTSIVILFVDLSYFKQS